MKRETRTRDPRSRILFFLLFCLASVVAVAQRVVTVEGVVTDASTGEVLPFAQIALKGTATGTVANNEGLFRLTVWAPQQTDTLVITYLGFRPVRIPLVSSDTGLRRIALATASLTLREVEIIAFSAEEVLRRAFDSIPVHFGADSVILTAFIRTRKLVNNRQAEYTEAVIRDLKDGYYAYPPGEADRKRERSNVPMLVKGRVRSDTNLVNKLGEVGAAASCLGCNFIHDVAEFPYGTILDQRLWKHYRFGMEELTSGDGQKYYRIRFDQTEKTGKLLYQGEILINARDFAILGMTYKPSFKAFDKYERTKFSRTWTLNHTPGWVQEMPLGETSVTYVLRDSLYSLSTIRINYRVTYTHPEAEQKIVYHLQNDVVVTEVVRDPRQVSAFRGDKSIGVRQRWDEILGQSDEEFWEHFNYLPEEE